MHGPVKIGWRCQDTISRRIIREQPKLEWRQIGNNNLRILRKSAHKQCRTRAARRYDENWSKLDAVGDRTEQMLSVQKVLIGVRKPHNDTVGYFGRKGRHKTMLETVVSCAPSSRLLQILSNAVTSDARAALSVDVNVDAELPIRRLSVSRPSQHSTTVNKVNVSSSHAVISLHVAVQEARSLCCAAVRSPSMERAMRHHAGQYAISRREIRRPSRNTMRVLCAL